MIINQKALDRFWEKVNIKGPDECWDWIAKHKVGRYGRFHLNNKDEMAHRFSWVIHNGQIPEEMDVLHHCDNPSCVNPAHLFLGTHQDNMRDALRKGRLQVGETCHRSKLTEKQVLEIRSSSESPIILAKRHGICDRNIHYIKNRETWKHI
ncbi:MAG: HNH endonuclease [Candidatus Heimdallarchaeota archaeon]|nr:HNH endonuclease [Candidatus Heimdallarchaeota archaeon]